MAILKDRDAVSGLALAGLGTFILFHALEWTYLGPDGPGPGFFPIWYGIAMIALSLGLVAKSVVNPDPDASSPLDWPGIGRAFAAWLAIAVTIALLPILGFPAALALLTIALVRGVMGQSLIAAAVTGIALGAGFWLVFVTLLGINLPSGSAWTPLFAAMGAR